MSDQKYPRGAEVTFSPLNEIGYEMPEQFGTESRIVPKPLIVSLYQWYRSQLSGPTSHDMCGVDQNDQRRHLATERLLQECRRMWGDQ